jgi:hypothetical protein
MTARSELVQLVGGAFDGDHGLLSHPLPEALWAWPCGALLCAYGGVHWHRADADDHPPTGAVRYTRTDSHAWIVIEPCEGGRRARVYVADTVEDLRAPSRFTYQPATVTA